MINTITDQFVKILNRIYHVGIYIRLSREDDKIGESESITNQRHFLKKWVEEKGYITEEIYVDDGYSGTNFDRPAFTKMLKDIDSGLIDMVITKDLSRLGRDYIKTGEFLEKYFPQKKVRYVAITDGIDTGIDSSNNDMAPFKAVFNDMYAKDISKKIRIALRTKQKEGLWVGGCPPLGYMPDSQNKNHLVVDPEEGWIVKRIFELANLGKTTYQIRTILTEEKVPTRVMIKGEVNNRISNATSSKEGIWSTKTIKGILTNRLYTGDMVQNRRRKISYKIKKVIYNDEEDWIIVPNTHEALVSKEDFNRILKILPKNSTRPTKKIHRLLDGILYCYECNHRIGICNPRKSNGKTYIACNYYRMHSKYNVCSSHGFNYDVIEKLIIKAVKDVAFKSLNRKELEKVITKITYKYTKEELLFKLKKIEEKYVRTDEKFDKLYMDKLDDKITEEMYKRVFNKITTEKIVLQNKIKEIKSNLDLSENSNLDLNFECKMLLEDFINLKKPNREMILELIDKIYIHKDKQIDIYFNFCKLN